MLAGVYGVFPSILEAKQLFFVGLGGCLKLQLFSLAVGDGQFAIDSLFAHNCV